MATIWGPNNPTAGPTNTAAQGDIFVSQNFHYQARRNATAWTGNWADSWDVIVPPETRGDVIPWDFSAPAQLNDRLAVVSGARPWETGWANAAEGVVGPPPNGRFDQTTPSLIWELGHDLGAYAVDVTVISPGTVDPAAEQTILVPRIEYASEMVCRLHFVEPVTGTAIVRR